MIIIIVITLRHITVFFHAVAVIRQVFIITWYLFSFLSEFLPVRIILEFILTFFLFYLLLRFLLVLVGILLLNFGVVGLFLHWCRVLLIVIIVIIIFISYNICLLLVERYTFLHRLLLLFFKSGLLYCALRIL